MRKLRIAHAYATAYFWAVICLPIMLTLHVFEALADGFDEWKYAKNVHIKAELAKVSER